MSLPIQPLSALQPLAHQQNFAAPGSHVGEFLQMVASPLHHVENTLESSLRSPDALDAQKLSHVLMTSSLTFESSTRVISAALEAQRHVMNMQV